MPVSNPSYFPPNRATGSVVGITAGTDTTGSRNFLALHNAGLHSTASDLLIIGDSSGTRSLSSTNLTHGLICLGNASMNGTNIGDALGQGIICVGINSIPLASGDIGDMVIVGNNVLTSAVFDATGNTLNERNTFVGNTILNQYAATLTGDTLNDNVMIGTNILTDWDVSVTGTVSNSTIIGSSACRGPTLFSGITQAVVIGSNAANSISSCGTISRLVVIGDSAGQGLAFGSTPIDAVVIGSQSGSSGINTFKYTIVGSNSDNSGNGTVVLGDNIPAIAQAGTNGCIIIGSGACTDNALGPTAGQLYIGMNVSGLSGPLSGTAMWGVMTAGNLCLGTSSSAQREFGGNNATNVLKLINGTAGDANPNGGGYFYVTSGALHWVGSNGTDTTIAQA